jgi:predicted amidohydrolase
MEKKTKIDLLAIQMSSEIAKLDSNIKKVRGLLEKFLKKRRVDFVILPEVWTVGWDCESFPMCAESIENAKSIKMLQEIAKKYAVNIIGGSFIEQKQDNTFSNTTPVINRQGELVCTYEKNHLFSYYGCAEGDYITKGNNPILVEIEGIRIGLSICYDIRFPEIYRSYRKANADILVNVAAWGADKRIPWDVMTKSRAVENQTYFVALTQTGDLKRGSNLGHSMIIDYKGEILSEIDKIEGGFYATIDLEEMYEFRKKCKILEDIKKSYEVLVK